MRIPDETLYKDGLKYEDRMGWVYCCHCRYCPISNQNQIYEDGMFWCSAFKIWKRGDDLLEYRCPHYRQKQCSNCSTVHCELRERQDFETMERISYCDRYTKSGTHARQQKFYGRRKLTGYRLTKKTLELEEKYADAKLEEMRNEYKPSDDKGDGIQEAGEHNEEEVRDAKVGFIQISNSHKKNKISWEA